MTARQGEAERLADGHLAMHQHTVQRALALRSEAQRLNEAANLLLGHWLEFLTPLYGLGQGDQVAPDGAIVRAPAVAEPSETTDSRETVAGRSTRLSS